MNVVGRVGSLISQGVYSVATPFHPFGGAIDVIVVQQQDGTFRTTPWYVRFGKFQGMLKGTEKIVGINVNGVDAGFHMYLDHSGEAFFLREVDCSKECETNDPDCVDVIKDVDGGNGVDMPRLEHTMSDSAMVQLREECHPGIKRQIERSESEGDRRFHEIQNEETILDEVDSQASDSEVILVSVDGHVLTAPVSGSEEDAENVQVNTPEFQLGPSEGPDFVEDGEELCSNENTWAADCNHEMNATKASSETRDVCTSTQDGTNGIGNTIEGCEGEAEGEEVLEGQETQNVVNEEVDILTQRNAEVDTHNVDAISNNIEVCEGKDEPIDQAQETTDNIVNLEADICTQESPEVDTHDVDAISNDIEVCEGKNEPIHQAQETETETKNVVNHDICTRESPEVDNHNVEAIINNIEVCEGKNEPIHQAQETETETENVVNQELDICTQESPEGDTCNVDAISNNIEVCEGENEPIQQAQEAENVVNQEADICTQESPEGDTNNVCSSAKDDTNDIDNKVEVCEGEHQALETQIVVDPQEGGLTQRSEEELAAIKKAEVFRSCVELPALVTRIQNTQKKQEKSKEIGATELRNNDEVSPSPSSGYNSPVDSPSPELHTAIGPVPITAFGREHFSDTPYAHSRFNALEGSSTQGENTNSEIIESQTTYSCEGARPHSSIGFEISLCGSEVRPGMGLVAAGAAFDAHRVSAEEFRNSAESITRHEDLIVRFRDRYFTWQKAAPIVLGMAAFGLELPAEVQDEIPIKEVETGKSTDDDSEINNSSSRRWRLWQIPFRRAKTLEPTSSNSSNEDIFVDSVSGLQAAHGELYPMSPGSEECPLPQFIRTNVPSNEQIESLNLKEGQNMITFSFSTRVLGLQQVDAHIYLWKYNARIVISDVDGTITKSDVLGQFMPLVGKDWSQSGVAQLFSAIKENGYQLLFLSARAIVQAYLTRSFLLNLKQDGKAMPNGPVVISPDGLFPSLFREVIRRAPHEFKIACLEDIKKLFPSDFNPFYAGFGNRDTDELSYRKIGIPKGKIFIINPKGEVAISRHRIDTKSYTSLHTLVNDMFPPTSMVEQEDFNNWNYWRMPLPEVEEEEDDI